MHALADKIVQTTHDNIYTASQIIAIVLMVKVLMKIRCLSSHQVFTQVRLLRYSMPCKDLVTIEEFEPYLGLRENRIPSPPTEEFRNVVFLGWGADYERRFFRDAEFSPSDLKNLIARIDGQTLFKYEFPGETKCSLAHVSSSFLKSVPQFLHNAGNDAYWETWSTLKIMEHAQHYRRDFAGTPAFDFHGDAIILCIDCEGWQGCRDGNPSELGFTVLDTRNLRGSPMNEWRNKLKLSTYHFRVKENMKVDPRNHHSRKMMHPNKFQFGQSQVLPEKECSRLLDTFFRIPSHVDSAEYLAQETRNICAGTPALRRPDPCTYVRRLAANSSGSGGGGRRRNRRRADRTPETESDTEMDKNVREEYFTLSIKDPDEIIHPDDFAQELAVAEAPLPPTPVAAVGNIAATEPFAGTPAYDFHGNPTLQPTTASEAPLPQELIAASGDKRKRDDNDDQMDEGQVVFMHERGAIFKNRRDAQINALHREFGPRLPQAFVRPKYKYVNSPLFPPGLKTGPQPYIDFDGKRKIIPRRFDCPHLITHTELVAAKENIACDGCYEKRDKQKQLCIHGVKDFPSCGAVLCKSCYNFLRPLHSKSRQHASKIRRRDDKHRQ